MNNVEQAKQEILSVMLHSGLTIDELFTLPERVQDLLYNTIVNPDMQFLEEGEQDDN